MSAHALAHHAPAAGGSFVGPGRGRRRVIVPPPPRASAVVDPRIGDLGPALLALEDGTVFPGVAFGAPVAGRRRPRRQHEPDRLPGGLHRPLVRRPGRGHDLPAHRQLRPPRRRRPVGASRGCGRSSWPTPPPPCSTTPASSRPSCATTASRPSPASTPGRSPGTCARTAACAGSSRRPGEVDEDAARAAARAVPRWEDQDFVGQVSPPAITEFGDGGRRRAARRDRRPRPEVEHRPRDAPSRRAGPRLPAHGRRDRRPVERRRRRDPVARPRRPGPARDPGRPGPRDHRRRPAAAGDLPRPPDRGPGGRRRDAPAAVRPPRREPPGPGRRPRARPGHGPEPRGPGRRRVAAGRVAGSTSASSTSTTAPSRACATRDQPIETVQYHPEGAPGPLDALAVFDRFVAAARGAAEPR